MTDTAQLVSDIQGTIEVLKRDGWTRGSVANENGEHCIMGAATLAMFGRAVPGVAFMNPPYKNRVQAFAAAVGETLEEDGITKDEDFTGHSGPLGVVVSWNRLKAENVDDVVDVLNRTLERLTTAAAA